MSSTMTFKNNSRNTISTNTTHALNTSASKVKRSTSFPAKRCETNLKAKLFGLRKELAELKKQLQEEQGKITQFMA